MYKLALATALVLLTAAPQAQTPPGVLVLQSHNPEQEEAEEELEVNYAGEELEIGFNVNYLLDALAAVDGGQVDLGLTDANNSCLLSSAVTPQAKYVVMPMRL